MKKKLLLILCFLFFTSVESFAFWVWTPETGKWVNPKYAVKETPREQLGYAMEFFNGGEYPKAITEFEKLIKHYPRAREAADAQYYIGVSFEKQDRVYEAFKAYQMVIDKYPFSERFPEVMAKEYEIGNQLLEGKSSKSGFFDFSSSDYNVIDVFRTIIKNAPYGEYAPPSQYKIGLYLLEKRLYNEARDEFEKVVNDYPDSEWAKAAKYQIAVTDSHRSPDAPYDQKITQAAVEEFKDFAKSYPDAELTEEAHTKIAALREKEAENNFLVAKFYEKKKQYGSAKIYYQDIAEKYKGSTWAAKALERIRDINALSGN